MTVLTFVSDTLQTMIKTLKMADRLYLLFTEQSENISVKTVHVTNHFFYLAVLFFYFQKKSWKKYIYFTFFLSPSFLFYFKKLFSHNEKKN